MNSYYAFCALMNYDENCASYIERYSKTVEEEQQSIAGSPTQAGQEMSRAGEMSLQTAIERGLKEEAGHLTRELVR